MSIEWYYQLGDKEVGPVPSSALKQLADEGVVVSATLVRRTCDGTWTTAERVRGLFPEVARTPVAVQSARQTADEAEADRTMAGWGTGDGATNGKQPTATDNGVGNGHASTPDIGPLGRPELGADRPDAPSVGSGTVNCESRSTDLLSTSEPESSTIAKTMVDRYRDDYILALHNIDNDVGTLIRQGKEMRALRLLGDNIVKIIEIHDVLAIFYTTLHNNQATLQHFGSERLRQLGHEPLPVRAVLKDAHLTEEELETHVLNTFHSHGIRKKHWLIKEVVIAEIEYMLDALQILIEPDFVPLENTSPATDEVDRYVPPAVKLAVWRRDQGKCVQCGTREKLEYDHIIPVSKGGSNTERNIQLLCEKCNREKAARIA